MSPERHLSLIYVSIDLVGGLEKSRQLLAKMSELGEIETISSVYKRYLTKDRVDFSARMEFVLRFNTIMNVDQCLYMLLSLAEVAASEGSHKTQCDLILLAYDRKILMSPKLTLPYPHLHTDALVIRCAAEAWGSYEHPIYQRTLSEISKTASPVQDAEFHLQGKSLVDF
ncbi:hypothetical protein D3C87_86670 [compost metagenome]